MGQKQIKNRIKNLLRKCQRNVAFYSTWPGDAFDRMPEMIEALTIAQKSPYHRELAIRALFDILIKHHGFYEVHYFTEKLNLPIQTGPKDDTKDYQKYNNKHDNYWTKEDNVHSIREWGHAIGVIKNSPASNYIPFQDRQEKLLAKAVAICQKRCTLYEKDHQYNVEPFRKFMQNAFAASDNLMPSLSAAYYLLKKDLSDYTLPIRVVKIISLIEDCASDIMEAKPPWRGLIGKKEAEKMLKLLHDKYNYEKFD